MDWKTKLLARVIDMYTIAVLILHYFGLLNWEWYAVFGPWVVMIVSAIVLLTLIAD